MLKPKLAAYFESYADYHRHPINRLTHKIGIPLIVFHIIAMLDWVKLAPIGTTGFSFSLGMIVFVAVSVYYFSLNVKLAALMAVANAIAFPLAWQLDRLDYGRWIVVAIAVVGWTVQFAGHTVWEKRQPAFFTNLLQALIGPFFFAAVVTGEWPQKTVAAEAKPA